MRCEDWRWAVKSEGIVGVGAEVEVVMVWKVRWGEGALKMMLGESDGRERGRCGMNILSMLLRY